ncbi:Tat (twin-arginine translocation) pathway signal sequence [Mariniphaga anaerophila]|uniref:Tat (Twin-arginine translocation) pathway signal sequence n=1 Tax=Mariniphaga anaerophila TaxID=1484053 RepID=A0A1M4VY20_9BACT|nr:aldo/keto reductase [Mariniphaga anaerophila]SHE73911.1 Tat (twin-arginine translocation) pathway signal sequence [Mariniphaga anaerophila]
MKKKDFTRRDFIKTTGAITAGAVLAPSAACSSSPYDAKGLPTALLGKTGVRIPRLIMGLGSRFMAVDEEKGLEILETALSRGLYYWDTAASYKNAEQTSEERLGKILKSVRNRVFLSTKVSERNADDAKRTIENSLKQLQTDYIDLYQIHSVTNEEEVRQFGATDGVLPVLRKYQEEGVIKYIGFTGHKSAKAMKLAAEMYDFDTMLIALNHQEKGKQPFEEQPVPFAAKKGMGVLGMKVIRPRETVTSLSADDLVKYALSLKNITAAVIGHDSVEVLNKNIATLQSFKPLSDERMQELRVELDPFYRNKNLPWMQPGYYDGMYWA